MKHNIPKMITSTPQAIFYVIFNDFYCELISVIYIDIIFLAKIPKEKSLWNEGYHTKELIAITVLLVVRKIYKCLPWL